MEKKVEEFFLVEHNQDDPEGCSAFEPGQVDQLGSFFNDNMEIGESWTVRKIKGVREDDPSGNSEYIVKEEK